MRKSCIVGMQGVKIRECGRTYKGVSGKTIDVLGECLVQVNVTPTLRTPHMAVVVPDHLLDMDFLYGADLLGKYDLGWSAAKGTFTWNGFTYKTGHWPMPRVLKVAGSIRRVSIVHSEKEDRVIGPQALHINQKVTLRKRSVEIMKFKVQSSQPMLEATLKLGPKEITILVKNQEGYVYLPLVNIKNATQRLKAGHMVATIEEVSNVDHVDLGGSACAEGDLPGEFKRFVLSKIHSPSLCTVCDSHFEILMADSANIPEICHLINAGVDKQHCAICQGMSDDPIHVRSMLELENTMIPDNLRGNGDESPGSRLERLKCLMKNQDLSHLHKDQRKDLKKKVFGHSDLFVLGPQELGKIAIPPVKLELEDDRPVRVPPYRHPERAKELILNLVDDMLNKDVIELSTASWLSPIVLVAKPNSTSKRFAIDFRAVNTKLRVDLGVLPRLDELVEAAAGHRYYVTVDMKEAYFQVVLEEASRDITTFTDGCNLYRFKRLPYGLSSAAAVFSRSLAVVLSPLARENWIKSYLDDIIFWANDFTTLLDRIEKVFNRFEAMGLKLNLDKCKFAQPQVKFLGHIVSREGISPCPSSVKAIWEMLPPRDVKGVRRFLGCSGFFRKYVSGYAKHALPLTNLTRKDVVFEWTEECQHSFDHLKTALSSAPVLVKARMDRKFIVHVDSSDFATGGALLQEDDEGTLKPVGFFSRKFTGPERRYSATDKEALGVVLICRYFHHYLWGSRFIVKSDHQALTSVFKQRTKSPRMNRWILEMRDYSFQVEYKRGSTHYVADHLSRPVGRIQVDSSKIAAVTQGDRLSRLYGMSKERLRESQRHKRRWKEVMDYLEGGAIPKYGSFRANLANFEMYERVLYYIRAKLDGSLHYCLVVPTSLKKAALEKAHAKHCGQKKTILEVEEYFYWPGYRGDAVKFVQGCELCQEFKAGRPLRQKWQELPPANKPLDRISVDLTDMWNGYQGYRYVLTVICHYSRFVAFYPLRGKTSEAVASQMRKYFLTIGIPSQLIADRGSEFLGQAFQRECEEFGVTTNHTLPFHPQGNSVSERMHRTFKTTLAVMSERNPLAWPKYLDDAAHALNTMVHGTTGAQPYFAFFSRHARRYAGVTLPTIESASEDGGVLEAHNIIKETSRRLSKKVLDIANRSRINDPNVKVGELVWVFNEYPIPGTSRKLNRKWVGPYRIEHLVRGGAAYKMSNPFEPEQALVSRAAEKIKKFYPEMEFLEPAERIITDEPLEPVEDGDPIVDPGAGQGSTTSRYPQRVRRPRVPYAP